MPLPMVMFLRLGGRVQWQVTIWSCHSSIRMWRVSWPLKEPCSSFGQAWMMQNASCTLSEITTDGTIFSSPFLLVYMLQLNIESQFFPQTSLTFNVSQKVFLKKMSLSSVTLPFFQVITYPIYFFRIRNMFFFQKERMKEFAIVVKMYPRTPASQIKVPGITCQLYFHFKFLLLPTWEVADDGSRSYLCGPPRLGPLLLCWPVHNQAFWLSGEC